MKGNTFLWVALGLGAYLMLREQSHGQPPVYSQTGGEQSAGGGDLFSQIMGVLKPALQLGANLSQPAVSTTGATTESKVTQPAPATTDAGFWRI